MKTFFRFYIILPACFLGLMTAIAAPVTSTQLTPEEKTMIRNLFPEDPAKDLEQISRNVINLCTVKYPGLSIKDCINTHTKNLINNPKLEGHCKCSGNHNHSMYRAHCVPRCV